MWKLCSKRLRDSKLRQVATLVAIAFGFLLAGGSFRPCSCQCVSDGQVSTCCVAGVACSGPAVPTSPCCGTELTDPQFCDCCDQCEGCENCEDCCCQNGMCECCVKPFLPRLESRNFAQDTGYLPLASLAPIYELRPPFVVVQVKTSAKFSNLRLHALLSVWLN